MAFVCTPGPAASSTSSCSSRPSAPSSSAASPSSQPRSHLRGGYGSPGRRRPRASRPTCRLRWSSGSGSMPGSSTTSRAPSTRTGRPCGSCTGWRTDRSRRRGGRRSDHLLPWTDRRSPAEGDTVSDHIPTSRGPAIVAHGLRKSFGDVVALDGVDLTVKAGTVFGLLGPNGAGKTTAVKILTTLLRADDGTAKIAELDVVRQADELRAQFDLADDASRVVKTYSGGMRRRLDLAASLIIFPEVLFLDEPTTGLDPRGRLRMWDIIEELAAGGATILLTTQYME